MNIDGRPAWSSRGARLCTRSLPGDCSYCFGRSARWPTLSRRCSQASATKDQSRANLIGPILARLRASFPERSGSTSGSPPAFVSHATRPRKRRSISLGKETPCRPAVIFCVGCARSCRPLCRCRSRASTRPARPGSRFAQALRPRPTGRRLGSDALRCPSRVLRATGAVKGVQITNVGGAGGAVGLPQFLNQWKGRATR